MKILDELERLEKVASAAPWEWNPDEGGPTLHANVYAPEFNPVLIARGCGCDKGTDVKGCIPDIDGDKMRCCPLHPTKDDRDLIATSRNALPALIAVCRAAEKIVNETLKPCGENCHGEDEQALIDAVDALAKLSEVKA